MGVEDPVIRMNASVVICRRATKRLVNLHARPYFLARGMPKVLLTTAVGKPFGKFKMILDKEKNLFNLEPVYDIPDAKPIEADMSLATITKDNRNLIDNSTSQKLKTEDIEERKKDGLLGAEMVDYIVENSATFSEKSEYSQQKYIRKKMEKYDDRITLLRPTLRLVAEITFEDNPLAVMNLRLDTISLLMAMCGVSHGGKYLIMEHGTNSLLTGGALERMGGSGTLVKVTYRFKKSELYVLDKLDLTSAQRAPLVGLPLDDFACLEPGWEDPTEGDNQFRQKGRAAIKEGNFDSVIVAIKDNPKELLKTFLPLLSLSKPFAVFSVYREVLSECHALLRTSGSFVHLKLTENWFREYQVLPGRTHPLVTMSGNGGFLLTGIKVENRDGKNCFTNADLPVKVAETVKEPEATGVAKSETDVEVAAEAMDVTTDATPSAS